MSSKIETFNNVRVAFHMYRYIKLMVADFKACQVTVPSPLSHAPGRILSSWACSSGVLNLSEVLTIRSVSWSIPCSHQSAPLVSSKSENRK